MINVGTCRGEYSLPMKETIFAACIEISSQPSFSLLITSGSEEFAVLGRIGSPEGPNPRISIPTLDVRPVSISCLCRKSATRARPLPSSSAPNRKLKQNRRSIVSTTCVPRVSTPRVVDFPLSTFPTTAHRTSGVRETLRGGSRKRSDIRGCPVLTSQSAETFQMNE